MRRFSGVTTEQIARICGISQGTVDRALHNRSGINQKTKERILKVAKEYGYAPHVKNASSKKSMLIGCVLFDLYNSFFSKLAMSIVEKAKNAGYSVIFQFSNKNFEEEKNAIEYFNYIGVDGILLFSIGSDMSEYTDYLKSLNRPLVAIGNKLNGIEYIGIDDEKAMYDMTARILNECKGNIAYFAPVLKKSLNTNNAQKLRLNGFQHAIKDKKDGFIITEDSEISDKYDAIICSTDQYLLRTIGIIGLSSSTLLAGFDNIIDTDKLPLKYYSVDYSTDQIAEECIKYILGREYTSTVSYTIVANGTNN